MSIERVNQKHALLVAQRGQIEQAIAQANANLNATIGAIAACEELRAEILADQSQAAAAVIAEEVVPEAVVTIEAEQVDPTPALVEMLAVSAYAPCVYCLTPEDCAQYEGCLPERDYERAAEERLSV